MFSAQYALKNMILTNPPRSMNLNWWLQSK